MCSWCAGQSSSQAITSCAVAVVGGSCGVCVGPLTELVDTMQGGVDVAGAQQRKRQRQAVEDSDDEAEQQGLGLGDVGAAGNQEEEGDGLDDLFV